MNVNNQAVPNARALSFDEMTRAIVSAGAGLGWNMNMNVNMNVNVTRSRQLKGTLSLRDHTAIVDIIYSPAGYSINYADSIKLKDDAAENSICLNCNGWIQRLDQNIKANLAAM